MGCAPKLQPKCAPGARGGRRLRRPAGLAPISRCRLYNAALAGIERLAGKGPVAWHHGFLRVHLPYLVAAWIGIYAAGEWVGAPVHPGLTLISEVRIPPSSPSGAELPSADQTEPAKTCSVSARALAIFDNTAPAAGIESARKLRSRPFVAL